jgi:hypothetical protein
MVIQQTLFFEKLGVNVPDPDVMFLPTRYSPSDKLATISSESILDSIHQTFDSLTMSTIIREHKSAISNLSNMRRTVFDLSALNCVDFAVTRKARKNCMANFGQLCDEVEQKVINKTWLSRRENLRMGA